MKWICNFFFFLIISITSFCQTPKKKIRLTFGKPGRYVVFPLIVKSPEYKWGIGAGRTIYFTLRNDSVTRTSNIKIVSFYTLRKQVVFASEGNIYFPNENFSHVYSGLGYEFQNVYNLSYNQDGQSLFDKEVIVGRQGGKISGFGFILILYKYGRSFLVLLYEI